MKTRPRKLQDPAKVQKIVDKYFKDCQANVILSGKRVRAKGETVLIEVTEPFTLTGLALALDVHPDVLTRYTDEDNSQAHEVQDETEEDKENLADIRSILKRARVKVEQYMITQGAVGALEPRIIALMLASNFGHSTKEEVKHSGVLNITTSQYVPKDEDNV